MMVPLLIVPLVESYVRFTVRGSDPIRVRLNRGSKIALCGPNEYRYHE